MTRLAAFVFDMDGVIVDSNPFHKIAIRQFCFQHGHSLSEQQLKEKVYGRTNRDWLKNLFGNLPEKQLQAYAEEKEKLFREIYSDNITALKGLHHFLDRLEQHSIPKAIATSAPRANVDFILSRTGLEKYFPVILDDTDVSHGKPDPEIYIKSAAALGLLNGQCIVMEDSISGVEAAKRAGSSVIGITTTHTADELANTDYTIRDFTGQDPLELIEKLGL